MSFLDSLVISAFGLGLVFVVLIGLSAVITLESKVFTFFNRKKTADKEISDNRGDASQALVSSGELGTAGELKLIGVEEKTAAMIMAIVSEESGIPLSELQFKSIKAID